MSSTKTVNACTRPSWASIQKMFKSLDKKDFSVCATKLAVGDHLGTVLFPAKYCFKRCGCPKVSLIDVHFLPFSTSGYFLRCHKDITVLYYGLVETIHAYFLTDSPLFQFLKTSVQILQYRNSVPTNNTHFVQTVSWYMLYRSIQKCQKSALYLEYDIITYANNTIRTQVFNYKAGPVSWLTTSWWFEISWSFVCKPRIFCSKVLPGHGQRQKLVQKHYVPNFISTIGSRLEKKDVIIISRMQVPMSHVYKIFSTLNVIKIGVWNLIFSYHCLQKLTINIKQLITHV